jgi:hypothetical protein
VDANAAELQYRYYKAQDGQKRISEWVELEKGKHYYIHAD